MKGISTRRLFSFGVLALALYFAVAGGEHSMLDVRRAEAELAARRAEIDAMREEIDSLRNRIEALRNDDEVLERVARERYGFIRDGEYLYRITEPETPTDSAQPDRPSILRWLRGRGGQGATDETPPGR